MGGEVDARLIAATLRGDVVARYWMKVLVGDPDQCSIWTGAISGQGHGRFWITKGHAVIAHRFGWALAFPGEPLPEVVAHRCDNPLCQNPNPGHWEPSTHADNKDDWASRRHSIGGPLRDIRGARGRALAIRDAAKAGHDIATAMRAGLRPVDRDQPRLF